MPTIKAHLAPHIEATHLISKVLQACCLEAAGPPETRLDIARAAIHHLHAQHHVHITVAMLDFLKAKRESGAPLDEFDLIWGIKLAELSSHQATELDRTARILTNLLTHIKET